MDKVYVLTSRAGTTLLEPKVFNEKEEGVKELLDRYKNAYEIGEGNCSDIKTFKEYCENNDLKVLLTRTVPVDIDALGQQALDSLPTIIQVFVVPSTLMTSKRFDAMLYLTRKECEHKLINDKDFHRRP